MNETLSASASQLPAVIPAPEPVTTATRLHHKYSASKMNYLEDCAAFTFSSTTNEAAEQGTLLHDLMDQMIKKVAKGLYKTTLEQVAAWLVKACELTEEEIGYLRFCCKRVDVFLARRPTAILTDFSQCPAPGRHRVESRLPRRAVYFQGRGNSHGLQVWLGTGPTGQG